MKQEKNIWEQSRVELFQKLDCRETGLSQEDAALRLLKYGANELHAGKQKSVLQIFLGQFADFLVLILILAAVISACMGDVESMIVILAVITMNAILGTVQTVKAAASLDSLKQMSAPTAKVLRDGQIVQIPGREVVPGDVVILEAGDSVCADGRLLECASLKCAESALTGESLPVEKDTEPLSGETALGDRKNMVFSGSFVTYGRGRFLVTATGMDTEMGKIAQLLKNTEERKTPLQVSLDQFGRKLSIIILVICAVLFGVSVLWRHENVMNAFLFAVALAVAIHDNYFFVDDMIEKPKKGQEFSNYSILGRVLLTPEIYDILAHTKPGAGGEIQLTDAMAEYARNYGGMTAVEFTGKHYDMGNKLKVAEAQVELALQHPEIGEAFRAYLKEFCKTL